MPFLLIRDDITRVAADAIVNPANPLLREGSGTSRAIHLAAGEAQLKRPLWLGISVFRGQYGCGGRGGKFWHPSRPFRYLCK